MLDRRRIGVAVLAALPVAFASWAFRRTVDPLAAAGVSTLLEFQPLIERRATPVQGTPTQVAPADDHLASPPVEIGPPAPEPPAAAPTRRARVGEARPAGGRPTSVFVGRELVQRALASSSRPRGSWMQSTQQRPAGVLIQSPGVLSGLVQRGDVLVEAEGVKLESFEQLVGVVSRAYARRARYLQGRLFRNGASLSVVVEPGW